MHLHVVFIHTYICLLLLNNVGHRFCHRWNCASVVRCVRVRTQPEGPGSLPGGIVFFFTELASGCARRLPRWAMAVGPGLLRLAWEPLGCLLKVTSQREWAAYVPEAGKNEKLGKMSKRKFSFLLFLS
jgi:hypothetical protein